MGQLDRPRGHQPAVRVPGPRDRQPRPHRRAGLTALVVGVLFAPSARADAAIRSGSRQDHARDDGAGVRGGGEPRRPAPRRSRADSSCVLRPVDDGRRRWGSRCSSMLSAQVAADHRERRVAVLARGGPRRGPQMRATRVEAATEALVAEVISVRVAAGLDLVTNEQVRWADPGRRCCTPSATGASAPTSCWSTPSRSTSELTGGVSGAVDRRAVLARAAHARGSRRGTANQWSPEGLAGRLTQELAALAAAGCPMVLVEEPAAIGIGTVRVARRPMMPSGIVRSGAGPPARGPAGAARDARADRRLGLARRRPDDPRRARPVLPVRPDRRARRLVPGAGGAGRPRHRLRRVSRGQRRRPAARARVGGALRRVVQRARPRTDGRSPTARPGSSFADNDP